MLLAQFLVIFVYIALCLKTCQSLRTCTVITPEFVHSNRQYSISLAVNNVNTSSLFEVTIYSINYQNTQTIEVQPNGVQIIEFSLPDLPRDEYVLRVNGENGICVQKSALLKYGIYKPIFVIQTDKHLYRRGETLHYRILCMDENLKPNIPDGVIDIKIMRQDHQIIYFKRFSKLEHFVINGELYLNIFDLTSIISLQQYTARLTVSFNNEILEAATFQIENDMVDMMKSLNTTCKREENIPNVVTGTRNISSLSDVDFNVQLENENSEKILTQNKVATFKISSSFPFEFFIFTIIGRGNIVHSERVQLLEKVGEYSFQLKPTNEMAPLSKLLVYFIDEKNNFYYDETMFNVEGRLENKISLTSPNSMMPNRKFEFNITTALNSYVGLLAIEETNHFTRCLKDNDDFRLQKLLKNFGGNNLQRGEITGSIILTTAKHQQRKRRQYKKVWIEEEKDLFEMSERTWQKTWLFAEISNTTTENFILPHNLPNEDTTWRVTAFALHPRAGLGFVELIPPLSTKKSYNISFNLPEFIYQNEVINIPIQIDNFLNEEIHIRVEFIQENLGIELIPIFTHEIDSVQNIIVPQKSQAVLKYTIRSSRAGTKYLKFLFFSLAGDDRQIVEINVKPKGVRHVENQIHVIDLESSNSFEVDISPEGPYSQDTMTAYPRFTAYTNFMEPILEFLTKENIDQNGEQAASMMAMACLSMHYLKLTSTNHKNIETQVLRTMHNSYLNLLDYRDSKSGGFSNFIATESGTESSWLTAYVGMWLPCVKKYLNIDETIIETLLDYLVHSQNPDGSFQEKGVVLNELIANNTIAMTAHVLLALLENQLYYTSYKPVLEKGIKFLVENLDKTDNLYAKTVAVYTFYKAGFSEMNEELIKLEKLAQITKDHKFWAEGSELELNNVATTAFVLLTAVGVSDNFKTYYRPALKWLIEKGNLYSFEYRVCYPTQATVLSLEVFIRYMQRHDISIKADLTVGYRGLFLREYKQFELREKVSEKHTLELKNYIGSLKISANGHGWALALITFKYNALKENNEPQFEVLIERPSHGFLVSFAMKVCLKYEGYKEYADLTILEAYMPSGYVIQAEDLEKIIESQPLVKHATSNAAGTEVKLYIHGLQRDSRQCISMEPFRVHAVAKQVPVPILCYEYTDVANVAVTYYDIELSTCDLCDGRADCIKNCYSNK